MDRIIPIQFSRRVRWGKKILFLKEVEDMPCKGGKGGKTGGKVPKGGKTGGKGGGKK